MTRGHNSTWNSDLGSYFNVESRPGVTFQRGIMTGIEFQRGILTRVTVERWIMTRDHISTWNYDPGSKFHVESWPWVTIPHWIVIPIPGQNLMLNHDSGSTFNVELRPGVIIQRGIKTCGSQFNGGPNFIRRRGRNTMTPYLGGGGGGRNSAWKIRWILSTARWTRTPRVEIQWGQNSILHLHLLPKFHL